MKLLTEYVYNSSDQSPGTNENQENADGESGISNEISVSSG